MCWLIHAAHLRQLPHFLLILLGIPGVVECFAGYRAWRFLLGLNGVFIGAVAGFMLCLILVPNPYTALGAGLVGAVGGGILCATVMPVGTFLVGLVLGYSAISLAAFALQTPVSGVILTLSIGVGLAVAGLLVVADRPAILVCSALAGAEQLAALLAAYLAPAVGSPPAAPWLQSAGFILLAGAGLATQWDCNRPPSPSSGMAAPPPPPQA